jgi:hypothetical protein
LIPKRLASILLNHQVKEIAIQVGTNSTTNLVVQVLHKLRETNLNQMLVMLSPLFFDNSGGVLNRIFNGFDVNTDQITSKQKIIAPVVNELEDLKIPTKIKTNYSFKRK